MGLHIRFGNLQDGVEDRPGLLKLDEELPADWQKRLEEYRKNPTEAAKNLLNTERGKEKSLVRNAEVAMSMSKWLLKPS